MRLTNFQLLKLNTSKLNRQIILCLYCIVFSIKICLNTINTIFILFTEVTTSNLTLPDPQNDSESINV